AVIIHKNIPDLSEWDISIFATDINPYFLAKAKAGIYTRWSFRNVPEWIKNQYFNPIKGSRFEIIPDIAKMVSFNQHNLADNSYPPVFSMPNSFDLIFCRNVIIYLTQECAENILSKFHHCLSEGGYLFTSAAESLSFRQSLFITVADLNATYYRKNSDSN